MQLPIYSREYVSTPKFIEFWSGLWTDKDEEQDRKLYLRHIQQPLTHESLLSLFEWKNQMPLSAKKRRRVDSFGGRLAELEQLSPDTTSPETFLEKFKEVSAIWRIFLLHCWSKAKYPIYDQHVHRAMTFICKGQREDISTWSDQEKINAYLKDYRDFFGSFSYPDSQKVDQALMMFGRFIQNQKFIERAAANSR